jgi:beta-glucosidase
MKRDLPSVALLLSLSFLAFAPAVRGEDKVQSAAVTPSVKSNPADPKVEQGFLNRHERFLKDKDEALKNGPVNLLFVGDSITDAWRNRNKDGTDSPQLKLFKERWGKYNPLNIGISGDRTQHVLWRLQNGEVEGLKPKAVVLMIGTNNLGNKESVEDTIAGVKAVIGSLREKLPDSKILLLGVFPRGEKADNAFRAQIKSVNEAVAKLDDGSHVKYLDIGDKFLAPDGTMTKEVMHDALHPSEKGYQIWADAIQPTLDEMMK